MKKVFTVAKVAAIVNVFLFFTLLFTTCGGGAAGGAGGASIPDSEYSTHNAGGWGGGGSSGGGGGSSGSGGNGVNMTGGTPLFVERYEDPVTGTFAGSQLNDLIAAIQNNSSRSNSVFNIPFYVVGDPVVRQARVTKAKNKVEKFEHQYKATCSIPPSTTPSVFYYYVDEGINLATITTAEMTGWQCQEDGSIHNGSHITNITGDVSLVPVYASGAGPVNAGVLKTDLHTAAIPDVGEIWDYAQQTGVQDGTAYITVPPPPMTVLYNENGNDVTWSGNYVVTININSTPIEFIFSSGDTQSKQITNIPVGATISATATINVTGSSRYASLTTPQLSTTIQAGGNLDMYFSYPYTCHIPSSLQSYTVVSGVNSGAYKNNGTPTDISSKRPTPESFEYNGQTLYFIGWSRNAADTVPEIAGDSIPANGTYHGALDLYAIFSSCSVSISIHDQTNLNSNILAENSQNDHITLTASTAGDLPENSTYSWTIVDPDSNPPVSLPPASGSPSVFNKSITVTPVTGRTGSATIKVTASGGGHSASKTIVVQVVAIALQETLPIVLEKNETKTLNAYVEGGYSGQISYGWSTISTSIELNTISSSSSGISFSITPNSGGKPTIQIAATLEDNGLDLVVTKDIDVYVFDLQLSGGTDTIVTDTPSSFPDADYDFIMDASRVSGGTLTANLAGFSPSEVSFTWENNATALGTFGTINSSGNSCTITPNGTTGYYVINLQASITGVAGTTKVFKVRYKTLGLQFTTSSPTAISKTAASAAEKTMTVEVNGYASVDSVTWGNWVSSVTSVASNGIETKINNTETATLVLNPEAGGITTVSMSATIGIGADSITLNASKQVYILDLQLSGTGVVNSTTADSDYDLIMKASDSGVGLTATLAGFSSDVTYSWTQPSSYATLSNTVGANPTITPTGTAGSTNFTLTASITGVAGASITKTIKLKAAGLTLEGDDTLYYNPNDATHRLSLALTPVGDVELEYILTDSAYASSNPTVATASWGNSGARCYVNGQSGGTTNITVQAKISGTDIVLTAIKQVTILKLDITGLPIYPSYSELQLGQSQEVTAVLTGASDPSTVTYTWEYTGSDLLLSATTGSTITVTPMSGTGSPKTLSVTATMSGTNYGPITLGVMPTQLTTTYLSDYISNLPAGNREHPNVLPAIQGLTIDNWTVIKTALQNNNTKYVDLSATTLPEGITDMNQAFMSRSKLVKPPTLPSTVTKMDYCFSGCTNLTEAPAIPAGVTTMVQCFYNCYQLTTPPQIPANAVVTDMSNCFYSCENLETAPQIPASVTNLSSCFDGCSKLVTIPPLPENGAENMSFCFSYCSSLENAPAIPTTVTDMKCCFIGCSKLETAPAIPAGVQDLSGCFHSCEALKNVPVLPDGIIDMMDCFERCTSLENAPIIPASVKEMRSCFERCTALKGTITLNTILPDRDADGTWMDCFKDCNPTNIEKIIVRDSFTLDKVKTYGIYVEQAALRDKVVIE